MNDHRVIAIIDPLLEGGVLFVLALTLLAFGMIHVWSVTVFRVVGVLLLVLWLMRHALARVPFRWRMDWWAALVLAYVAINVASLAVSVNLDDSQEEVANLLAYLAVFFVTVQTFRTPRQALRLCGVQVAVAVLLSIYSILQHYGIELIAWSTPAAERSFATLANANRLAGYLIMVAPLLIVAVVSASSRLVQVVAAGGAVLVYAGLTFTYSRGGWVAFLVSLGCLGIAMTVAFRRRLPLTRRTLTAIAVIVLSLAAVTVAQRGSRLLDARLLDLKNYATGEADIGVRLSMWQGTLNIIAAHPWLGTGIGTYRTAIYKAEPEELQRWLVSEWQTPTYSHNDYLQTASEIGLPGLFILLALLFFSLSGCGTSLGDLRSRTCALWS